MDWDTSTALAGVVISATAAASNKRRFDILYSNWIAPSSALHTGLAVLLDLCSCACASSGAPIHLALQHIVTIRHAAASPGDRCNCCVTSCRSFATQPVCGSPCRRGHQPTPSKSHHPLSGWGLRVSRMEVSTEVLKIGAIRCPMRMEGALGAEDMCISGADFPEWAAAWWESNVAGRVRAASDRCAPCISNS